VRRASSLVLIAGALLATLAFAPAHEKVEKTGGGKAPRGPSPEHLVRQLGDPDFEKREAAFKALQAAGTRALPALRKGLKHPDIEVRKRAGRLVAALEARLAFEPALVTLDAKDRPTRDVLDDLTRQTHYRFLFVGGGATTTPAPSA
jgi:HEAT repeat protein